MALMVNGIGGGGGGDLPFSTRQIAMANICGVTGSGTVARMGNLVHIVVNVVIAKNSSIAAKTTVATIPEGFRPIQNIPLGLGGISGTGSGQGYVNLQADGILKTYGTFGSSTYATGFELSQFYMTAEPADSTAFGTDEGGVMVWEDITPFVTWKYGKYLGYTTDQGTTTGYYIVRMASTPQSFDYNRCYTEISASGGDMFRISGWVDNSSHVALCAALDSNDDILAIRGTEGNSSGVIELDGYHPDVKVIDRNTSGSGYTYRQYCWVTTTIIVPKRTTKLWIRNYALDAFQNGVGDINDIIIERASTSSLSGSAIGQTTSVADIQLLTVCGLTWADDCYCIVVKTGKFVQFSVRMKASSVSSTVSSGTNTARIPDGFRPPCRIVLNVTDPAYGSSVFETIAIDEDGYISGIGFSSNRTSAVFSGFYICA